MNHFNALFLVVAFVFFGGLVVAFVPDPTTWRKRP